MSKNLTRILNLNPQRISLPLFIAYSLTDCAYSLSCDFSLFPPRFYNQKLLGSEVSSKTTMEGVSLKGKLSRPHFFKIIMGEDIKQHMRIPPAFMKHLPQEMPNRATLTAMGRNRRVRVSKNADGTYIEEGWKEFVEENNLGDHEFLMFRYDGNMRFYVQIFDRNGVERLVGPVYGNTAPEETTRVGNGKRARGARGKRPVASSKPHKQKLCGFLEGPGESSQVYTKSMPFRSQFPYFTSGMTKSNVDKPYLLPIPKFFSIAYLPPSKCEFLLKDSAGVSWAMNCVYQQRRHLFSGGWRPFVRHHKIKLGDVCTFEFVNKHEVRVHFF